MKTIWRVESLYDFEPFEKHDYYTLIPGSYNLKLPDGLSEYMTKIGVAKAFWYKAEWSEVGGELDNVFNSAHTCCDNYCLNSRIMFYIMLGLVQRQRQLQYGS